MIVGFSGTRLGLTDAQSEYCEQLLVALGLTISVIHGDCIGADADFHKLSAALSIPIEVYPPANRSLRAFCAGPNVTVHCASPYLARNRAIVDAADMMLCAPGSTIARLRNLRGQGTWSTIHYARAQGVRGIIVSPDGSSEGLLSGQPDV